jgi:hypothetical protein
MSVVRQEDFEPKHPEWVTDPTVSAKHKHELLKAGFGEAWTWTQYSEMDDDCFLCGNKLTTPFVFWRGMTKTLCLHPQCAGHLGGALTRDWMETRDGKVRADKWWRRTKPRLFAK